MLCNLTGGKKKIPFLINSAKSLSMAELLSHSNDLWEVVPVPNALETLCSLVLHLPVESFRTKGLSALHMKHTPKEHLNNKANN